MIVSLRWDDDDDDELARTPSWPLRIVAAIVIVGLVIFIADLFFGLVLGLL